MRVSKTAAVLVVVLSFFGYGALTALAQEGARVSYVPLIGISSVPQPLALPDGPGDVTYQYAVKNFLKEYPLTDVRVDDDKCSPVAFVEGDDNGDGKLDYDETWRYTCTAKLVQTTQSVATAIGTANGLPAAHKAYATVIVGSDLAAPLVNIINITKVAYPLTLPIGGGDITFTYRVNNPGVVPLSDVSVTDDKCDAMSSKLGDTNGNGLLDITEVWVYTCTTHLERTTTNTVSVTASANGLKAVGYATITVTVETLAPDFPAQPIPSFPETGPNPGITVIVWGVLSSVLAGLLLSYASNWSGKSRKTKKSSGLVLRTALFSLLVGGATVGVSSYFLLSPRSENQEASPGPSGELAMNAGAADVFGWKYPVAKFPTLGSTEIAYSDIRDPGGIPEGLPVRLKIPIIGVDTAIEDAYITPDGRMDVPVGSKNVAWFALGPNPGEVGSAVIGGHFGIKDGVPFVFYDLDKLKTGDYVYVVDDRGDTLAFVVRDIKLFDRDADATTVFTSDDGIAHLNLITCEGIWNKVNDTYPQRRVVFTDAVPAGSGAGLVTYFRRSLSLGLSGTDVIELQTALVARGFLKMPAGVAKGYFGSLTRSAVIRYQASVGLSPSGIFDRATSTKLLAARGSALPAAGADTAPPPTDTTRQTRTPTTDSRAWHGFILAMKSLFTPPVIGMVTSLLLFGITYVALKIRRTSLRRSD
jgi:LPXTG-site transpeptidase (sortase) family protein